jgi:hypothetical protein
LGIFFAIHVGRTGIPHTFLKLITPGVALLGDIVGALLIAVGLILPVRLLVRKLTRPAERSAWQRRLLDDATHRTPFADLVRDRLLNERIRFALRLEAARASLMNALWMMLKIGLPVIAVVIAVNPIWGFSWFFNSENWASIVWQEIAAVQVDDWREQMLEAVERVDTLSTVGASHPYRLFPQGLPSSGDFSFLVIGDTGEGDGSQLSLKNKLIRAGDQPDVRFLVISSDVIYPDGLMKDYEPNFYIPFNGFSKPIYAIPGNHDWFDSLDGFVANFYEPEAASAAMRARMEWDERLTGKGERYVEGLITEARRLRGEYRVKAGLQRTPFFQMITDEFAFIAADTGILRRLDRAQEDWLESALQAAGDRFIMVLLGHPLYAGGHYQGTDEDFARIHDLLRKYEVPLVMAGDTHDFEYYQEVYGSDKVMHHFVNGGGGAYLSIGTALSWPSSGPVTDYAYYPSTRAVYDKLELQTPSWKWPLWWWIKSLRAWPVTVESLSSAFDFNRSPFFQSFMEVRVIPSKGHVKLLLYGTAGRLRWQDLQVGGNVIPEGAASTDPVEFIIVNER